MSGIFNTNGLLLYWQRFPCLICFSNTLILWLHGIPTRIGLKNNNTLKCCSNIFPVITHLSAFMDNKSELLFNIPMFSHPGDKVLMVVEITGKNCPVVFLVSRNLFTGLENNNALKCNCDNLSETLTCGIPGILLAHSESFSFLPVIA